MKQQKPQNHVMNIASLGEAISQPPSLTMETRDTFNNAILNHSIELFPQSQPFMNPLPIETDNTFNSSLLNHSIELFPQSQPFMNPLPIETDNTFNSSLLKHSIEIIPQSHLFMLPLTVAPSDSLFDEILSQNLPQTYENFFMPPTTNTPQLSKQEFPQNNMLFKDINCDDIIKKIRNVENSREIGKVENILKSILGTNYKKEELNELKIRYVDGYRATLRKYKQLGSIDALNEHIKSYVTSMKENINQNNTNYAYLIGMLAKLNNVMLKNEEECKPYGKFRDIQFSKISETDISSKAKEAFSDENIELCNEDLESIESGFYAAKDRCRNYSLDVETITNLKPKCSKNKKTFREKRMYEFGYKMFLDILLEELASFRSEHSNSNNNNSLKNETHVTVNINQNDHTQTQFNESDLSQYPFETLSEAYEKRFEPTELVPPILTSYHQTTHDPLAEALFNNFLSEQDETLPSFYLE